MSGSPTERKGVNRRGLLGSLGMAGAASVAAPVATAAPAVSPARGRTQIATPKDLVVDTVYGPVRGYIDTGIRVFKGIPYARPPVGAARFRPPEPPAKWTEVRWALVQGFNCPQYDYEDSDSFAAQFIRQRIVIDQDEDCLKLNVWTPAIDGKKRPVMVWLHGGAFLNGSAGNNPATQGGNLARRGDMVVVSLNHRLNVFGYLDLSDYGPGYKDSVNAGALDMVAALRWVRDNIARFGGDPGNVTIFGQSGGGAKVATLMSMPSAMGLFRRGIIQSSSSKINSAEASKRLAQSLVQELGLSRATIGEIEKIPTETLLAAGVKASGRPLGGGVEWRPAVDGTVVSQHPFDPTAPKISADLPLMIGGTRHEFSHYLLQKPLTEQTLEAAFAEKFGAAKGRELRGFFKARYPDASPTEVMALVNVQPYRANHYRCAALKAQLGGAPCYAYMFAWKTPQLDGLPLAFHSAELPFVFANTEACATYTGGTPEAAALSAKVSDAWIAFARIGDPNHPGLPAWPKFDAGVQPVMVLDETCRVMNRPFADEAEAIRRASAA
jgi:para-nitrobenzyl esterase